jgi:hypothetical protein
VVTVEDELRKQLAASLPNATPAQVDNLMETAKQLGEAMRGVEEGTDPLRRHPTYPGCSTCDGGGCGDCS